MVIYKERLFFFHLYKALDAPCGTYGVRIFFSFPSIDRSRYKWEYKKLISSLLEED